MNWNVERSNYSDDVIKLANGYEEKLWKLSFSLQHAKSKEVYNEFADSKINRKLATVQPKILRLNADAVTLIIDSAHIKNAINNKNLGIFNLNSFYTSIDVLNLYRIRYPEFVIHKRKNLKYEYITSSPMYNLALGIYKSLMDLFFEFSNELGVSNFLKYDVSKKLFELCDSNIDFLPITMLNECKTTGWLTSDFIRTIQFMVVNA